MSDLLQLELETYEANKAQLVATDSGRYVLIHGDAILGTFDTEHDAITQGYRQLGHVPFFVRCIREFEEIITFYPRLSTI